MNRLNKPILFDIDGCISDDWHRLKYLPENGKCDADFKAYHDRCAMDKPMNHDVVNKYIDMGKPIIFITTRPDTYENATLAWLSVHFGQYERWDLMMRPAGDTTPSPELKRRLLEESDVGSWGGIEMAYDDRDDVLGMYDFMGIPATKLTYPRTTVPVLLEELSELYREKQKTYGPSYLRFGELAKALWPDGLTLRTTEDFVRHGILVQCLSKIMRYANTPAGHLDSARDLALYATILLEQTDE